MRFRPVEIECKLLQYNTQRYTPNKSQQNLHVVQNKQRNRRETREWNLSAYLMCTSRKLGFLKLLFVYIVRRYRTTKLVVIEIKTPPET